MTKTLETPEKLKAFEAWWNAGKSFLKTAESTGVPERTLRNWALQFDWLERASARNRLLSQAADEEAIAFQKAMMKRHRDAGRLGMTRGLEYLANHQITSARDAIRAIQIGIQIERQAEGLPSWVTEILNADAETLQSKIAELEARRRGATAGVSDLEA